jgi:hypothetical protein
MNTRRQELVAIFNRLRTYKKVLSLFDVGDYTKTIHRSGGYVGWINPLLFFVNWLSKNPSIDAGDLLDSPDMFPSPTWYDDCSTNIVKDEESAIDYIKWFSHHCLMQFPLIFSTNKNYLLNKAFKSNISNSSQYVPNLYKLELFEHIIRDAELDSSMTPIEDFIYTNTRRLDKWQLAKSVYVVILPFIDRCFTKNKDLILYEHYFSGPHKSTENLFYFYKMLYLKLFNIEERFKDINPNIRIISTDEIIKLETYSCEYVFDILDSKEGLGFRIKNSTIPFDDVEYADISIYRELKLKQLTEDE